VSNPHNAGLFQGASAGLTGGVGKVPGILSDIESKEGAFAESRSVRQDR